MVDDFKRNSAGHFANGNKGGPGNPKLRRGLNYQMWIYDAATKEDIQAVFLAMVKQAKAGDALAARDVLNRVAGKPRFVERRVSIDLPEIVDIRSAGAAMRVVTAAASKGEITLEEAEQLSGVIEVARRTFETVELAAEVEALKQQLKDEQSWR